MPQNLNVDEIRAALEKNILTGELKPGDRLNELSLSARLDTSRGVIRQAVRALEEARLVEVVPNRGALVRTLGLVDALQLFDVRAGLARSAGRLAALRADKAIVRRLEQVLRSMARAVRSNDVGIFGELNHEFHGALFDAAANEPLRKLDTLVRNELQLFVRRNLAHEAQLRRSLAEHQAIVDALKAADCERCAEAFEKHILNGKQRLMDDPR